MTYRPTFGPLFPPASSVLGAIPVAAFGASIIGTGLVLAYSTVMFLISASTGGVVAEEVRYLPIIIFAVGLASAFSIIAGTFLTSFYLFLFGLPVATLMRSRLHGPLGLVVSIAVALLAALVFMGFFSVRPTNPPLLLGWEQTGVVLAYALPAGLLYRRTVISLLEELD